MRRSPEERSGERGAVLIHVAIALLVLTAFSALAIDYGILWVGRAQAQNAADAGALGGAFALAFDNYDDRVSAAQIAQAIAVSNRVWSEPPSVDLATDITFPDSCVAMGEDDPRKHSAQTPCIRVEVHRTKARENPLPTIFAQLVGVGSQDVKAVATAEVMTANSTDCLKPLAIPDKWTEITTITKPWPSADARFNKYDATGTLLPASQQDVYRLPTDNPPGGYQVAIALGGLGYQLKLTEAPQPRQPIGPGHFIAVDLDQVGGGSNLQANIESCNGVPTGINTDLPPIAGSSVGQVTASLSALMTQDPGAWWNQTAKMVQNSCAASSPPCASRSPRLIALPVFDIGLYEDTLHHPENGPARVRMVNVIGFFIESVTATQVVGRIAYYPGLMKRGSTAIPYPSAFLRTALLTR